MSEPAGQWLLVHGDELLAEFAVTSWDFLAQCQGLPGAGFEEARMLPGDGLRGGISSKRMSGAAGNCALPHPGVARLQRKPMNVNQTSAVPCGGVLADGTNCAQSADTGRYCPDHVRFEARDLDMLRLASEHFRLDLQLFWQCGSLFLLMNTAVATVYAAASQAAG